MIMMIPLWMMVIRMPRPTAALLPLAPPPFVSRMDRGLPRSSNDLADAKRRSRKMQLFYSISSSFSYRTRRRSKNGEDMVPTSTTTRTGKQQSIYDTTALAAGSDEVENTDESPLTVVVVGGGWAGFTAADALASMASPPAVDADGRQQQPKQPAADVSIKIHLLDASPRGLGGLAGGWQTRRRQLPVEAGIHGFWREYRNTFDVMEHSIGLDLDQVLTPYTPSLLVSSSGRVALAPVLGELANQTMKTTDPKDEVLRILQQLDWNSLGANQNNITKQLQ